MVLERDLLMQREALRVLREQLEIVATYLGSRKQTEIRNRRLAVLATIRDLERTHSVKLTPNDALWLWRLPVPPIEDPGHLSNRKHFFDFFRHLTKEDRNAKARMLKREDDNWMATIKKDQLKMDRLRSYIKANSFPKDVSLQDIIQVASRINEFEISFSE